MVDLDLFRIRGFSGGAVIITLYFMGVTSVWVLVAMYMRQGLGHTALAAGLMGLPAALLSAVSADVSGRFVFQIGRKLVVWGIVTCLLGLVSTVAVVVLLANGIGEWWMMLTLSFVGIAQGMVISPNQTLTLQEVPPRYAGSAGGVLQTGRRIGTSMGLAIITALAFAAVAGGDWSRGSSSPSRQSLLSSSVPDSWESPRSGGGGVLSSERNNVPESQQPTHLSCGRL